MRAEMRDVDEPHFQPEKIMVLDEVCYSLLTYNSQHLTTNKFSELPLLLSLSYLRIGCKSKKNKDQRFML